MIQIRLALLRLAGYSLDTTDYQVIFAVQMPLSPTAKYHILHVVRSGFAGGGMENGIINISNRLPEEFRSSVCALDSEETFSRHIKSSGARFFTLPKTGSGIQWSLVTRLADLLKKEKVDLVHSHNWGTYIYAVSAAALARKKIIHGEHGKNPNELDGDALKKRLAKKILATRVNRVAVVSQNLKTEWLSHVSAQKIVHIRNGVDSERFRPRPDKSAHRRIFGLPENAFTIGSIGRLDTLKNHGLLIKTIAAMERKDVHLAIIGRGPCEEELKAEACRLGLGERLHLLGHHESPELFLNAIDIFALASRFEGMSNVVLEAMATGLPVAVAELPTHHEILTPKRDGVMFSANVDSCVAALNVLCSDSAERSRLGTNARNTVLERFSIAQMVNKYIEMYRDCLR